MQDHQGRKTANLAALDLPPLGEHPLVSILLSSYNYEAYIGQALQSVLDQTYQHFELIICDDGSTDSSVEVIRPFLADDRITLVQKENGGQASALNAACEGAKGEIICLLDSDDSFYPAKLEHVVSAFAAEPLSGCCIHRVEPVSGDGTSLGVPIPRMLESGWIGPRLLGAGAATTRVPPTVGLSFRRKVAGQLLPMPVQFRRSPDAYLVRAAFFRTSIVPVPEVLASYRVHESNILGLFNPSVKSATIVVEDARLYVEALRVFLASSYGPGLAQRLNLTDNPVYWINLLVLHLLEGEVPRLDPELTGPDMIARLPPGREKLIWRALLKLPRIMAIPLFRFWWGNSPVRRWTRRVLYTWNR